MRYLIRILESALVVWAVASAAFFGLRLGRIDPLSALSAQGLATPDQAAEMRSELGLDQPIMKQYADYLAGILHGDLGRSLFSGQDVAEMIRQAAAYTIPLAAAAWVLSVLAGVGLGAAAARRDLAGPEGAIGRIASAALAVGASTPVAWSGLVLVWISVPVIGAGLSAGLRDALDVLLPALALAVTVGCGIGRAAESSIRQARGEPFHLAMRAHGFPTGGRADWKLLRAAIAPVLTLAGVEAAFLLGGTMITEVVFARPGLGRILVDAILRGDYPVVQAVLGLAALGYVVLDMTADFSAAAFDPRLREAA
jgi:ABC-type dipeptide/oligopeptide/nickel transport system permease component